MLLRSSQKSATSVCAVQTMSPMQVLGTHDCGNKHVPALFAEHVASLEQLMLPLPVQVPRPQFAAVVQLMPDTAQRLGQLMSE